MKVDRKIQFNNMLQVNSFPQRDIVVLCPTAHCGQLLSQSYVDLVSVKTCQEYYASSIIDNDYLRI